MQKKWFTLYTGFALFAMFFGSGNLVFPIGVGQESGGHYLLASLGILLSGVFVPFLGVFGMLLYQGDLRSYFSCFGKTGTFWFSLLALALMGPFGVMARCLTVAHGALQLLFPQMTLPFASALLCALIFLLSINKNKIVSVLGSVLTPVLLLAIAAIAFMGLRHGSTLNVEADIGQWKAFSKGFFQGYQTMDLLAAFFFSTFVIKHLETTHAASHMKIFCRAALIGASILAAVYMALVALGAFYQPLLVDVPPQEMLGTIAMEVLGSFAAPCVCIAIVLACLTTAIVLASLFADFLRKEVACDKIGNEQALLLTLLIGFFISTLEFAGIAKFLGPILECVYPALITLTVINIAHKLWGCATSHWPVTLTLAVKLIS